MLMKLPTTTIALTNKRERDVHDEVCDVHHAGEEAAMRSACVLCLTRFSCLKSGLKVDMKLSSV
eukprot:9476573-Pyramimonas_sp.AAC.1